MKPREQFIEEYRHQFAGLIFDVVLSGATGAEFSLRLRNAQRRLDVLLSQLYATEIDCHQSLNGKAQHPVRNP